MNRIALLAILLSVTLFSCKDNKQNDKFVFDYEVYKTQKILLAEEDRGKYYNYSDSKNNQLVNIDGKDVLILNMECRSLSFYDLESGEKIQGICPEKYHIPNYHEWDKLLEISQSNEQIKQLLIYPQQDFNKRTNTYAFYDESLVDNFNITGNHDRKKEVVSPWRWTFTATMQPYTCTSIIGKETSYESEYYYRPPHTLRCVKD